MPPTTYQVQYWGDDDQELPIDSSDTLLAPGNFTEKIPRKFSKKRNNL